MDSPVMDHAAQKVSVSSPCPRAAFVVLSLLKDPSKVWMSSDGVLKDLSMVVLGWAGCSALHRAGRSPRVGCLQ